MGGEGEGTLTLEAAGIRVGVSESCPSVPAKSLPVRRGRREMKLARSAGETRQSC